MLTLNAYTRAANKHITRLTSLDFVINRFIMRLFKTTQTWKLFNYTISALKYRVSCLKKLKWNCSSVVRYSRPTLRYHVSSYKLWHLHSPKTKPTHFYRHDIFVHADRKDDAVCRVVDWLERCMQIQIERTRQRLRPRKTSWDGVLRIMESFGLSHDDAQDRDHWRQKIKEETG